MKTELLMGKQATVRKVLSDAIGRNQNLRLAYNNAVHDNDGIAGLFRALVDYFTNAIIYRGTPVVRGVVVSSLEAYESAVAITDDPGERITQLIKGIYESITRVPRYSVISTGQGFCKKLPKHRGETTEWSVECLSPLARWLKKQQKQPENSLVVLASGGSIDPSVAAAITDLLLPDALRIAVHGSWNSKAGRESGGI